VQSAEVLKSRNAIFDITPVGAFQSLMQTLAIGP